MEIGLVATAPIDDKIGAYEHPHEVLLLEPVAVGPVDVLQNTVEIQRRGPSNVPSLAHSPAIASVNNEAVTSTELLARSNVLITVMIAQVPALAAITTKDRRIQRRHIADVHLAAGGATLAAAIAA